MRTCFSTFVRSVQGEELHTPFLVDEILRENFLFGEHQAALHFGTILNLFFHSVKINAQVDF
jgi:hypothetical protein